MNKANLKSYAPKARLDFIKAVTERANMLGITALGAAPAQVRGDVAIIEGTEWPAKVAVQRDQLIARMQREGFAQTCEAVAYTWFNRFAALRYMELHDYLGHGHRALSSSTSNLPDILTHAADLAQRGAESGLPGLNAARVVEMKLAGNRDGELYRMLLVAQCNVLNAAMPFLFERIDDDTELLLPDNLLRTDSVIAKLVQEVPEEDWAEVEVIGWLYQFYISEKKDQVIGKVVKSEDIPAATQLFTPNWIVQYLVQNSVGRQWLMANPASILAGQWPYYIQPAKQTPEVQARLDALIQTRMDEDGGSLNPETITVLDPACGSGHILVVAYDVLKAIYLERGYQARAIPRLILEKNLYGLDIDDRAAQMAGFALLMKARADDRRLFNDPPQLNVMSLQESKGLDAAGLAQAINAGGTERVDVAQLRWLIDTFEDAKTFGSLIKIGHQPLSTLRKLLSTTQLAIQEGDLYAQAAAQDVLPLVQQALVLGMQFDTVVANPPYMGGKGMIPSIKEFARRLYPSSRTDLFSMFMARGFGLCKASGNTAMVTMQSWMFLSSFEDLRREILQRHTFLDFVQIGYNSFPELNSKIAQACAFVICASRINGFEASFNDLNNEVPQSADKGKLLFSGENKVYRKNQESFRKIPGSPLIFHVDDSIIELFDRYPMLGEKIDLREGIHTADNERFLRQWHEVSTARFTIAAKSYADIDLVGARWVPYNKGGSYRKWYGNNDLVIAFDAESRAQMDSLKGHVRPSQGLYFKPGGTWSALTSGSFGLRYYPEGFLFDSKGQVAVGSDYLYIVALMNTRLMTNLAKIIMPTLDYKCGDVKKLPFIETDREEISANGASMRNLAKVDWDLFESSWDFDCLPFCRRGSTSLEDAWLEYESASSRRISEMVVLERKNNNLVADAAGLSGTQVVGIEEAQIVLTRADREKDCQRLISYAIGCMMGRYSLDEPGLIYAHARNLGFDVSRYATFPADADGIVPLTDERWFADDAASRVREFLLTVWGQDTLEENMAWLAESLGTKASETSDETIRRYLADKFFKDHLQTYKKRPIYWLFSSGKQGAFQALVYLHRYTEGTLARLRAEYVVPLIAKVVSRLDMLGQDVAAASSAAARTKLLKQIEALRKKQIELLAYDEKLRHCADMRITLDLDDGVKVNYGKFGDLLDGVKLVTGGAGDD